MSVLYIVHCIDTEGPLEETLAGTFERLRQEKGIDYDASMETLTKLQKQEIDLSGREQEIQDYLAPKRLAYLDSWNQIEKMILSVTSEEFRYTFADPKGNPYTFSWFVVDTVGYKDNPRRKAVGFHVIWDQYQRFLKGRLFNDTFGWHFHTVPVNGHALHYNTCWTNNDWHEQAIARRLLERRSFPSLFRAGGAIERIDSSFWLEQFIPFDYSCASLENNDFQPGEMMDWRFAETTWGAYHPCFYDYRRKGRMNRFLLRCLDIDSNHHSLTSDEIEKAFTQVDSGSSTILSYSCHDRRDIRPKIESVHSMIKEVSEKYPHVEWVYTNAQEAVQKCYMEGEYKQISFTCSLVENTLFIESNEKLFGPHPFLAVQEGDFFYRDNVTMEGEKKWAYKMACPNSINKIGIAGSNLAGDVGLAILNLDEGIE